MATTLSLFSLSPHPLLLPSANPKPNPNSFSFTISPPNLIHNSIRSASSLPLRKIPLRMKSNSIRDWRIGADDDGDIDTGPMVDDMDSVSMVDYSFEDEDVEPLDNRKDFDFDYDVLNVKSKSGGTSDDIQMVETKSFVSTQGWDPELVVDYKIDEDEFHKISLQDCDYFIRKLPDPDNDVYDFREMYVTPPDTDVYSIPKLLAPIPQKCLRCAITDYAYYTVTEPPIDAPRDPLAKRTPGIMKVFLTKHYKNRRASDREFVLDFEEIYVIDSKTKSITRAKVLVTAPGGRNRDRKDDLLVIRDNGTTFKIIHENERDDPSTVVQREEWYQTRHHMEKFLRKHRDFDVSNWF